MTFEEIKNNSTAFLEKYNVAEEFYKCGLSWETLMLIAEDFRLHENEYSRIIEEWKTKFLTFSSIHSIKGRVKDIGSLLKKVILISNKENMEINSKNYTSRITDLMGIRLITIFKEDIVELHRQFCNSDSILKNITEVAYNFRSGDDQSIIKDLGNIHKVTINEKANYRSLHYLLSNSLTDAKTEIQIRTIFEEGWSEIDHELVYKCTPNPVLYKVSSILSSIIGSCNDLGELMKQIDDSRKKGNEEELVVINDIMKRFLMS